MSASVFYEDKLSFWVFLKKLKFILTIFENFRAAGQFCLKWNVTKCSKLENIARKNAFFWYYINIQTFFCLFICCNCGSAMCHLFWNPESKNNKKIRYTCKFFYCIDMLFRSLMAMKQTLGWSVKLSAAALPNLCCDWPPDPAEGNNWQVLHLYPFSTEW